MGQQLGANNLHRAGLGGEKTKLKAEKQGSDGNFRNGMEDVSNDVKGL